MSNARIKALLSCAVASLASAACTYGVVSDASDDSFLGGAVVKFRAVNLGTKLNLDRMSVPPEDWPRMNDVNPSLLGSQLGVATWSSTDPGSNGGHGAYYLNPYGNIAYGENRSVQVGSGWNRIAVGRSGYDGRVFYRNHLYLDCEIPRNQGPISASSYPYVDPLTAPFVSAAEAGGFRKCAVQNFELFRKTQDYIKDPDMIVNLRSLRDHEATNDCDDLVSRPLRCLRVTVSTANVGSGPLEVRRDSLNTLVYQRRQWRNGRTQTSPIPSRFELDPSDGHNHIHLLGWTEMRLRRVVASCASEVNAANCGVAAKSDKEGFCLQDGGFFDSSMPGAATTYVFQGCPVGAVIRQGISVGWQDTYGKTLDGQAIPIDGLPSGDYWLEVEVNPVGSNGQRAIYEGDYTNNVTRLRVRL